MSETARVSHDYASILNTMVRVARARGLEDWGGDHGLACYQILEAAISDAAVSGVPLAQIGLEGFDTNALLSAHKKPRRQTIDDTEKEQGSQETSDWRHYWSIIYNMIYVAKERGLENPGSGYALACHQIVEAAISAAKALKVPLADIELEGFDTGDPFGIHKKSAHALA
ncbi:hypothetical protein [Nitrosovibrio sp. Nv17]|uniref:hypothetical protein n=1 Tax=Nitrosovibrio sp. Nv17 TaxID=1855339 RepID=UPI000908E449|nr:hypothetical protein [Nitrosovibrio sp. Nv17]SFW40857.1 hypothetical protein SAMN05216414_1464 [Nitrosovibrio sp. Nv17]